MLQIYGICEPYKKPQKIHYVSHKTKTSNQQRNIQHKLFIIK